MVEAETDITKKSGPKKKKGKKVKKVEIAVVKKAKPGRDIGVGVPVPKESCTDNNCPFHGGLSVRGIIMDGTVVSDRMTNTAVVEREYLHYLPKYERYEKRTGRYSAHNPPCINAKTGDKVKIGECRPLSKTVSFVIISKETKSVIE